MDEKKIPKELLEFKEEILKGKSFIKEGILHYPQEDGSFVITRHYTLKNLREIETHLLERIEELKHKLMVKEMNLEEIRRKIQNNIKNKEGK
jgi:hypothetical protein